MAGRCQKQRSIGIFVVRSSHDKPEMTPMPKRTYTRGVRLPASGIDSSTRGWLARIALSLAIALLVGALAFLITRAIAGVALLAQQQEFLRETSSALQGGILGLAQSNLREVRRHVQQIDARNQWLSLLVGFVAAAVAAVASYLWMERRASVVDGQLSVIADD
jgi:hypothetical protein